MGGPLPDGFESTDSVSADMMAPGHQERTPTKIGICGNSNKRSIDVMEGAIVSPTGSNHRPAGSKEDEFTGIDADNSQL